MSEDPQTARLDGEPGAFLALLTPEDRAALEETGRRRSFPRGAVLMYTGEPGDRVMVVLEGRVKITRAADDGQDNLLNIRGPGDLLGELSFIDEDLRLADVTALEPVTALVVASSEFRRYLDARPRVALVILTMLSRRYRDATVRRAELDDARHARPARRPSARAGRPLRRTDGSRAGDHAPHLPGGARRLRRRVACRTGQGTSDVP